jgi:hypothetical protein
MAMLVDKELDSNQVVTLRSLCRMEDIIKLSGFSMKKTVI